MTTKEKIIDCRQSGECCSRKSLSKATIGRLKTWKTTIKLPKKTKSRKPTCLPIVDVLLLETNHYNHNNAKQQQEDLNNYQHHCNVSIGFDASI
jgi:hypothetical protein